MAARAAKAAKRGKKRSAVTKTKRSSSAKAKAKAKIAPMTWAKAIAHPTRLQILAASHQGEISPADFAKDHEMPTGTAAFHFKKLRECEAIELVREERVSGSVRHVYVGSKRALYTKSDLSRVPESIQTGLVGAALEDFVGVAVQAIESGTFTARGDFVLTWDEIRLDEIAWTKLGKMLRLVLKKVPSLEEESEGRMASGGDNGFTAAVGLAAFELPWPKSEKPRRKRKSHARGKPTG